VNHARHLDRDLGLADLAERITDAGVVVQRQGAAIGDEAVGFQPVVPQHHGISRNAAHLLDEASEMPGDLRVSWTIIRDCGCDHLGLSELVDLNNPRRDRATDGLPDQAARQATAHEEGAKEGQTPVPGLHACADPMRSSQIWPAR
jgi:hypothetical protein